MSFRVAESIGPKSRSSFRGARLRSEELILSCLIRCWAFCRGQTACRGAVLGRLVKKFLVFMEPRGSLPCSQNPVIKPFRGLLESSTQCHRSVFLRCILILCYLLYQGLQSDIFPSDFSYEILYACAVCPVLCNAPPIWSSLTLSP
jgi:hypothetical protein